MTKIKDLRKKFKISLIFKSIFWFGVGATLGLFFTLSFAFIFFQKLYANRVFPGVYINNFNVGGKTENDIVSFLNAQNKKIGATPFTFTYNDQVATASAKELGIGYNSSLLAHQAFSLGRSNYMLSDVVLVFKAYFDGVYLPPSFTYDDQSLLETISPISKKVAIDPVDALFTFQNGRVTAFQPSSNGQQIDVDSIKKTLNNSIPLVVMGQTIKPVNVPVGVKTIEPKVTTESANNMGIKELIGTGTSLFQGSIPSRIHNVELAASRINGILIPPNEVFSFDQALGDVSAFTGYQQAYIIQNGRTILGDGGGVCQVSTTIFRAALSSGLPIVERHGHAYRVEYYEEDGPPGIDATVYVPTVDLKFKNDTGHYILVQTVIDPSTLRLTFNFYGTKDGRQVSMTTPVVSNIVPAPAPLFIDDPTLPKGKLVQTDFSANGAHVSFNRTVTRNGQVLENDTFVTNFQPWQAIYRRGV